MFINILEELEITEMKIIIFYRQLGFFLIKWSRLKRLTDSFNGLNCNIFNTNRDINDTEYFNGWICVGLFYMRYEYLKLGLSAKKRNH